MVALDVLGLVVIPAIAIAAAVIIAYYRFKRESLLRILLGLKKEEVEELKTELRKEIERKKEYPPQRVPRETTPTQQPGPDPWRDILKIINVGKALVELGKMLPEEDEEDGEET